jgi:hypothetical protein
MSLAGGLWIETQRAVILSGSAKRGFLDTEPQINLVGNLLLSCHHIPPAAWPMDLTPLMASMENSAPQFSFHLDGAAASTHSIPASVLVQVIENAQSAVELIGCDVEGKEFRQRVKIPSRISRKYQLVCHVPVEGSYALPMSLGDPSSDLFALDDIKKAWKSFTGLLSGISARDAGRVKDALPDSALRRRVLEYVKGMAPSAGADWRLGILDNTGASLAQFDEKTLPFVQATLVPPEQREAERTITGELKSINFTQRQFSIVFPPTNRELVCSYDETVEDLLYENRRSLIQVTGRVVLNDEDQPKEIHSVSDIRDLDLSPFTIDQVRREGRLLRTRQPLVIEPTLDDDKQFLCLNHEELGIDVFAHTREQLAVELAEQLAMLWDEFALANDDSLEPSAQQLKRALLQAFEELNDAT